MRRLETDHDAGVLAGDRGGALGLHLGWVGLRPVAHAGAVDVDERQHARLRAVDHALAEIGEIAPAGGARIDHRSDAGAEREGVGRDAEVGVRAFAALAGVEMDVDIDQPRDHHQTRGVDHTLGLGGGNRRGDAGDFAAGDGHVGDRIETVLGIDHAAAADQQIVRLGVRQECATGHHQELPQHTLHPTRSDARTHRTPLGCDPFSDHP